MSEEQDLVDRLRIRADIRRQIPSRKSVQEGKPDRIADLLEEAAIEICCLRESVKRWQGLAEAATKGWEISQQATNRSQSLVNHTKGMT